MVAVEEMVSPLILLSDIHPFQTIWTMKYLIRRELQKTEASGLDSTELQHQLWTALLRLLLLEKAINF